MGCFLHQGLENLKQKTINLKTMYMCYVWKWIPRVIHVYNDEIKSKNLPKVIALKTDIHCIVWPWPSSNDLDDIPCGGGGDPTLCWLVLRFDRRTDTSFSDMRRRLFLDILTGVILVCVTTAFLAEFGRELSLLPLRGRLSLSRLQNEQLGDYMLHCMCCILPKTYSGDTRILFKNPLFFIPHWKLALQKHSFTSFLTISSNTLTWESLECVSGCWTWEGTLVHQQSFVMNSIPYLHFERKTNCNIILKYIFR